MSHMLQEQNKNEKKCEKREQEEESELRILIFLKASPLFRYLGKCHCLKWLMNRSIKTTVRD
jgi:hypothetical protein